MNTFLVDYQQITSVSKGFSKLFTDYTSEGAERESLVSGFFHHDERREADYYKLLGSLSSRPFQREKLADMLLRQNRAFGVDDAKLELLDRVRSPRCMLVVTGQQPGLFTGPLYTLYKALSTVVLCERHKAMFPEYDFLPLFWIESDDHDFEESGSTSLPGHLDLRDITLRPGQRLPGQMVSRTVLGSEAADAVNQLAEYLQDSEWKNDIIDRLKACYAPGATLESGFGQTMAWLMKDTPLFFLSPGDAEFKQLCTEVFLREISTCPETSHRVIAQSSQLEQKGYSTQAKPRRVNLFMINDHDQRQKIEQTDNDMFELTPGRQRMTRHQLLELCGDHPERFSPNVVLRPIVQDHAMPVFAYVAGPGEISYLAQYRKVYEHFNLTMPFILPRGSFTLIEPGVGRTMEKVMQKAARPGLPRKQMYRTFFTDMELLRRNAVRESSEHDYDQLFDRLGEEFSSRLDELQPLLAKLDPTLEQSLQGTGRQIDKALDTLRQKTHRAARRKHDDILRQIDKTAMNLFPGGIPQERVVNSFYYINKYGPELIAKLADVLQAQSTDSHIILEL
ncbi:bacillithiol biosynthesis cysteine-adding enzyme BshC [Prosthecochloris sp. N3]|uniref:Putative cysteine ligase BshC n=1 Tax=Prosthecochloris ethylica TaxID=2743976 RepID=A0ABR9XNF3_9CHLB|nr:bacillithiol biosynthesis cysteine-adding enzyme BshC [Prosthecochloris ethylica]MBF0635577.1 bacillithiol biosynthesis cysteine-adding enzyme BshC [Prosthecochloris ethylica]NUK46876.1 bacillithiol biosynthesis cysteine-adding enzyme BshC [Prosthecochloris ethylica]